MIVPKLRFSEFKDDWQSLKYQDVLTIQYGKDHKNLDEGNIPVYGTGGIMRYVNKYLHDGESILIGRKGTIDQPKYVNERFWTVDTLFFTKIKENAYPKFIYQHALQVNWLLRNEATGVPSLNTTSINNVEINLPSFAEQTKIAEFLSAVDDKISQLSRQLELLNQYKKGVMQKIFSQEIRFKNDNGEDFGEWRTCNILEIADVSIGLVTTMTTNYAEIGVPLIRNSDIKQNKIRTSELIYLTPEFANSYENRKLKHKDIVTVHTGDVGVSSVIPQELHGSIGFATINTRVNENEVNPFYLSWFFNSENFINWCVSVSTGDGRQNLNLKDFNNAVIKLPIIKEQEKIAEFLTAIDERIDHTTAQLTHTKQWKKGLLQQMFV